MQMEVLRSCKVVEYFLLHALKIQRRYCCRVLKFLSLAMGHVLFSGFQRPVSCFASFLRAVVSGLNVSCITAARALAEISAPRTLAVPDERCDLACLFSEGLLPDCPV